MRQRSRQGRDRVRALTTVAVRAASLIAAAGLAVAGCSSTDRRPAPQSPASSTIAVDTAAVPLDPQNQSRTTVGDFVYAGGLAMTSRQTTQLHGLSDLEVTGTDRLTAIGDEGVLFQARLVLNASEHLVGVRDARLERLTGEEGKPLLNKEEADAEGFAQLANGDRLVSFERRHRIWRYPASGGAPRPAPTPTGVFPANAGLEALAADPETGADAYVAGAEDSGETWTCRVSTSCVKGPTVDKSQEFGLVGMKRLPGLRTAILLRAFDLIRGSRLSLQILRANVVIARMDMVAPLTVDNFEGLAAVPRPDNRIRLYLLSDDNNSPTQRTLLLAFDWRPR